MLACARIGAIHSVVFGGFASKELADRIDDCLPKLIITSSCGLEPKKIIKYGPIVNEALGFCKKLKNPKDLPRLIYQRLEDGDKYSDFSLDKKVYFDYEEVMKS